MQHIHRIHLPSIVNSQQSVDKAIHSFHRNRLTSHFTMRERQLLRTKTSCASVAGLVSKSQNEEIEAVLSAAHGGGIDPSGLAFLVTGNRIRIWKQDIFSLSEEIIQELAPVVGLEHPDQNHAQDSDAGIQASSARRVALAPSLSGMNYANSQRKIETIYNGMSLYWSSPNGTICYWNDISESGRDCDVFISLPLRENELVTFVTRHDASGAANAGSILVGTSRKRTFHVWKNARPLELQARLLFADELQESNGASSSAQGGLLSGMYTYIFTPSKPKRPIRIANNVDGAATDDDDDAMYMEKPSIVGIFNFSMAKQRELFTPSKRMKHTHPNRDPSKSHIYTISDDGCIDTWTCEFDSTEGAYIGNHVGSTNIASSLNVSGGENLNNATVLCADLDIGTDSASIVVCVKASVASESGIVTSRFYLAHLPIDVQTGQIQSGSSIWLSRYANHAITSTPNPLLCAGVVTAIEDMNGESSTVAYCTFHQKRGGHLPVTVSAVRFASSGSAIVDIDMPPDISPHVVAGALQHDSATDGCNMICTTGCVTNVRAIFPSILTAVSSSSRSLNLVDKGMVDVLVGHIYSAFETHRRKNELKFQLPLSPRLDRGTGSSPYAKRADSFLLPPAISNADGETLSLAVVAVSAQLVDEPISQSDSIGELRFIEDKVGMHQSYIKYLIHVGVYKRVNISGRLALRDHGEMAYAIGGLLTRWNTILEIEARAQPLHEALNVDEENHKEEMLLFGNLVKGLATKVTKFPENFLLFQQELVLSENEVPTSNWVVFALLTVHCEAIQIAMTYRSNQSVKLYDISDLEEVSMYHENGLKPWTSSTRGLATFEHSLRYLQLAATAEEERSQVFQQMQENIGEFVKCLASIWLDGYKALSPSMRNEGEYDSAKSLSYVLLTAFCPPEEENDEDIAFSLSLAHAYFFGVVELCHQHANLGRYDPKYDLVSLVSEPVDSLDQSVDHETGLSFQQYVLRWHTDRNMFGTVLQLGKYCQDVLSKYMEEDERLADVRWIQNVRSGHFTKASTGLIGLSSDGITALGEKPGHPSLVGRQLVMSLAKLGALASTDNSLPSKRVQTIAQENLDLCEAQEILADMVDSCDISKRTMDANELMSLAMDVAQSADDNEVKFRACLAGLSIAKAMSSDGSKNNTSRQSHIAKVWAVSINADAQTWSELFDQWDLLSDDDKESRLRDTVFYNVATKYYSDPSVQKRDEVGFTRVQNEVVRLLAMKDGFSDLLTTALNFCGLSAQ